MSNIRVDRKEGIWKVYLTGSHKPPIRREATRNERVDG
jgi:hypothetical protein